MAVINAIEVCFLDSEVWGCLFHLVQNLKKKLGKKELKGRYYTDPDFAVLCRMITAMAFVPPDDVMPVFEELWDMLPLELEPILLWMQKNYIGSVTRRDVFIAPRFSHSLWNVYERTLNRSHRTNNFAEAANHPLQVELDVCHPGLWKFINSLRTVQQGRDQKFIQWQAGKRPKAKRTKYVEADRRILTTVQDYENRSTEEFLKGIANNFEMED